MKINKVDAFPLRYPEPNDNDNIRHICLARIETDDGIVGWGECVCIWAEAALAVRTIIERGFAAVLIGRDPTDVTGAWDAMKTQSWWYGEGGIASFALSACDMAMWDLKGKVHGLPLHQLLGGKLHSKLRACASTHPKFASIDDNVNELAAHIEKGYTAVKVGFGKRGEARLGVDAQRDIDYVKAVCDMKGNADFMVDIGNGVRWDVPQAIRMTQAFEQFGIRWIEDPLRPWDYEGYTRLQSAIHTPIAMGEREWTLQGYRRLLEHNIADIVLVDPGRAEGVSGFLQVMRELQTRTRFINAHSWSSAVNTAAAVQLIATASNYIVMEVQPKPGPMNIDLVHDPIVAENGWITVPDEPGLGVDVNMATVAKYSFG